MKIGIMGYYPPPIGGISMHVKRLAKLLETKEIDYKVYSISSKDYEDNHVQLYTNRRKWATRYLFSKKEDIIHCHTMGWLEKAYYLIVAKLFGKKIIYTLHSFRDKYDTLGFRNKLAYRLVMRYGDHFIVVGKNDYDYIMENEKRSDKFTYLPGFIAPIDDGEEIPDFINDFIDRHETVISANSSNMNFYNGEDLYGIDLCVDLVIRFGKDSGVGVVFLLPNINNPEYYESLKTRLEEQGVAEHFLFVHEVMELYKITKKSTLFVRPTNTDGDAISIREALYYGIPVVASDAISRPSGVVEFKNRDLDDFYSKVNKVINEKKHNMLKSNNFGLQILDIYHKLYNG